jgi:hypothetical protein
MPPSWWLRVKAMEGWFGDLRGAEREEYASMEMPRCFRAVMSKRSIGFGFGLLGDEDKHLFCPTWISRTHTHTHTKAHVIICLNYSEVFTKAEKQGPTVSFHWEKGIRKVKRTQEPHVSVSFQVEEGLEQMVTHLS